MASFPPLTAAYQLPISFVFSMSCVALALLFVVAVYNDPRRNSCAATLLVLLGLVCALGFAALFPTDVSLALADARYGIVNFARRRRRSGRRRRDRGGRGAQAHADGALRGDPCGAGDELRHPPSMDLIIGSGAFGSARASSTRSSPS